MSIHCDKMQIFLGLNIKSVDDDDGAFDAGSKLFN